MPKDNRDLLDVLKFELHFLEDGGYGRSPHTPAKPTLIFEDSPTCINFNRWGKPVPCSDCLLMQLVPQEHRSGKIPCRQIPLDAAGHTVNALYESASQSEAEEVLGNWLRETIHRLEQARAAASPEAKSQSAAH